MVFNYIRDVGHGQSLAKHSALVESTDGASNTWGHNYYESSSRPGNLPLSFTLHLSCSNSTWVTVIMTMDISLQSLRVI